jgi:selenocysteine lyase/cysteine desulfurase
MLDIRVIRQDFPALHRSVYLNTGGVGLTPKPVYEFLTRDFADHFVNGPPLNVRRHSLQMEKTRARAEMARFIGANAEEICFTRGVSDGTNIVLGGLSWRPGDEIITTNEEHSAFVLPALLAKRRFGAVVRILELDNDRELVLDRFQKLLSPRTRLVMLSHVTTDNGIRLPVEQICAHAHQADVPVFLDGAQAIGQFPVNVREVGCDFYGLLSYKWLLGPYSAGALYIAQDWCDRLTVCMTGARAERSVDHVEGTFQLLPGARCFEFGPHAWSVHFAMLEAARYLTDIGLAEIQRQVRAQTAYLREGLAAIPGVALRSPSDPELSTGIVTFSLDGISGHEISEILTSTDHIITRPTGLRFDGVRISVAFFTSREELDILLEATDRLARRTR